MTKGTKIGLITSGFLLTGVLVFFIKNNKKKRIITHRYSELCKSKGYNWSYQKGRKQDGTEYQDKSELYCSDSNGKVIVPSLKLNFLTKLEDIQSLERMYK